MPPGSKHRLDCQGDATQRGSVDERSTRARNRPSPASTFLDYVLADPVVLPFDQQAHWTERVVHLPDCSQANDRQRPCPSPTVTRADLGLPDAGFVFCCLNNSWKITAPVFDIWMRLLRKTPGSVLWLLGGRKMTELSLARLLEAAPRSLVIADIGAAYLGETSPYRPLMDLDLAGRIGIDADRAKSHDRASRPPNPAQCHNGSLAVSIAAVS